MTEMTTTGPAPAMTTELETLGAEIRNLTAAHRYMTLWYATEIGKRLTEAKEKLEHGRWMEFLKTETEFSSSSASRLMTVYREYGNAEGANFPALGNISVTKALSLLAVPEEEREAFAAEVDAEHLSTRELEQAIRERDAALAAKKQAEDEAEGAALRLGEIESQRDDAIEELEDAKEEANALRAEVKKLRERPVDVAVEVDEDAVDKARTEGKAEGIAEGLETAEKKHSAELEKFNKKLMKATKELDAAKSAQEQAEAGRKQAEQEAAALRQQMENAGKKETINGNADLVEFNVYFKAVQEEIHKMRTVVERVDAAGQAETAAKLRRAVAALGQMIGEISGEVQG